MYLQNNGKVVNNIDLDQIPIVVSNLGLHCLLRPVINNVLLDPISFILAISLSIVYLFAILQIPEMTYDIISAGDMLLIFTFYW